MSSSSHNSSDSIVPDSPPVPTHRSHVAVTSPSTRKRPAYRFDDGTKVYMREAANKPFELLVVVVEREYEEVRGGWNYTVKYASDGTEYPKSVEETNLTKAT